MILSVITKQEIEQRLGKKIRYPSDYDQLSYDIERITTHRISTNTLKRLLGAIASVKEPRLFTLDVIAQYLGHEDWDAYIITLSKDGNSQFDATAAENPLVCQEILADELPIGAKVEIQYYPNRKIILEHLEGRVFKVVDSINSKLKSDDIVEMGGFYLNYPLIITNVLRESVNIGRFTAGKVSGLTYLKIIE